MKSLNRYAFLLLFVIALGIRAEEAREFLFNTPGGVQLSVNVNSRPESQAVMIITHGILEHSGRYSHVVNYLVQRGYAVVTYDLRGHGRSGGPRADVNSFSQYVDDLDAIVSLVAGQFNPKPMFLLGHSMGGLITYLYSSRYRVHPPSVSGYVLIAPSISPPPITRTQQIERSLAPYMTTMNPDMYKDLGLKLENLVSDPEILKQSRQDPLLMKEATIRLLWELLIVSDFTNRNLETSSRPSLMIQGTSDTLVDWKQNLINCAKLREQNPAKFECVEARGQKHEVLNAEPAVRNSVLEKIDQS